MVPPLLRGCVHVNTKYLYIYSIPQAKLWQNSWFDCYKVLKAWIFDQKHLMVVEHHRFRPWLVLRVLRRGLWSEATPRTALEESQR